MRRGEAEGRGLPYYMLWLAKLTSKTSALILNLIWGFSQALDADFAHKIFINVSDAQ